MISRLLLDGRGLPALDRLWREISRDDRDFDATLLAAKRRVLDTILAAEFAPLVRLLGRIAAGSYRTRDHGAARLRTALELFILHFPVYRTYVTGAGASASDRAIIAEALAVARTRWVGPDGGIFDFLRDALTMVGASPP